MRGESPTEAKRRIRRLKRNYKAEYRKRIDGGVAKGLSITKSRGHKTVADLPKPKPVPVNRDAPIERALQMMRRGTSQSKAAMVQGVSVEKLRLYRQQHTLSVWTGKAWEIKDTRPVPIKMATKGKRKDVIVEREVGREIAQHWKAVSKFLNTNDASHLAPFVGRGVRDLAGHFHQFETWPNTLWKMDSVGELTYLEIYSDVAP